MNHAFATVAEAMADLRLGKMVLVMDDQSRENEGDLIMAAEKITPQAINFMLHHGRGLICMPMLDEDFQRLNIPMMVTQNRAHHGTPFGVSFGAAQGITTGISAFDRAETIRVAADPNSQACDIVMPGHVFPLCAQRHGVLVRRGHTEASVDLMRLAGLRPQAVVCEVMNDDGTMARLPELIAYADKHQLKLIRIQDIVDYRLQHEQLLKEVAVANLPINAEQKFKIKILHTVYNDQEVTILLSQQPASAQPVVRIHSECLTGDAFGSARCDCGWQLQTALQTIDREGGVLIYLRQEGRGIGLANKIKAYGLQDQGLDTVEANLCLGFQADLRNYALAAQALKYLGFTSFRLLTNNPDKITDLQRYGDFNIERESLVAPPNKFNQHYLQTKVSKLGHLLTEKGSHEHSYCSERI